MNSVQEKSNTTQDEGLFTLGRHLGLDTQSDLEAFARSVALLAGSSEEPDALDDNLHADYDDEGMDCD